MRKKPHISRFIITLSRTGEADEAHHAACSGETGLQPSRDGRSDGLTDGSASDEEQGDDDSEDQAEQSHGEVVQALDALGVRVVSLLSAVDISGDISVKTRVTPSWPSRANGMARPTARVGLEAVAIARMAAMMPPMTALGG